MCRHNSSFPLDMCILFIIIIYLPYLIWVYKFAVSADGLGTEINEQGVAFYNNLIDFMIEKGATWYT